MSKIKEVIFLDHYVTYCCLILGPATVGQYLDFESVHLKESEVLIKMIHCYLIYEQNWAYTT